MLFLLLSLVGGDDVAGGCGLVAAAADCLVYARGQRKQAHGLRVRNESKTRTLTVGPRHYLLYKTTDSVEVSNARRLTASRTPATPAPGPMKRGMVDQEENEKKERKGGGVGWGGGGGGRGGGEGGGGVSEAVRVHACSLAVHTMFYGSKRGRP